MKFFLGSTFLVLFLISCSKYEGEGGSATIKGVIREQKYNSLGNVIAEYPIADQDVYIIYGNGNTFYDDDIKTSYDGSFQFRYLKKGSYKIFVYEDCSTCPSGKKEIIVPVEITKNNQTVTLDTINIKKI
ncbi:MAG: hypothetical protein K9G36_08485 [Crocinitomicaceae bacterium]|nr:hypothetical protein [Crocinitomicaceae bacterium]MCF8410717.1 hypothetical protein [Crocinitomicaceae bacterium]MCF8444234.1 hypothetical protein [Crocinitomicaceae bacterium]